MVVLNEANQLSKKHTVTVVYDPGTYAIKNKNPVNKLKFDNFDVIKLKTPLKLFFYGLGVFLDFNPSAFFQLRKIINEKNPDIIHIHNVTTMGLSPFLVARLAGKPIVYTAHDSYLACPLPTHLKQKGCRPNSVKCIICQMKQKRLPRFRFVGLRKHINNGFIDKLICPSRFLKEEFEEAGLTNISVIPNGVNLKKDTSKHNIRLGNKRVVLFVGYLDNRKGPLRAIKGFLDANNSGWIFTIVGGGPQEKKIKETIRENNASDSVMFLGKVSDSDLSYIYEKADIFYLPTLWENNPLTIIEAMSHGCAILSSNGSGVPEVVGDNGFLVDPRNTHEQSKKLSELMKSDKLQQFKKTSKELFKKNYAIESHTDKLEGLYSNLLEENN